MLSQVSSVLKERSYKRWISLWERLGAQGRVNEVYRCLTWRYSEIQRSYHTIVHIDQCLNEFEQVRQLANNPDAVEFALWYHDAIYNPRGEDNEEASADLAAEVIRNVGLPDSFGQLVANLIMASKHNVVSTDSDTQLFVDIDLSILGQDEDYFDEYELRIRHEYDFVSDEKFIAGRSVILKSFLDRPNIYSTEYFRKKYEAQARLNIARSLAQLSKNAERSKT